MEIKGKLLEVGETQQIKDTFQKREFVLEYVENPTYPEYLKFELIQDRCPILDGYAEGDEVSVSFNLKGRKWTNPEGQVKYFNSLQAWKIDRVSGAEGDSSSQDTSQDMPEPPEWVQSEADDDLPF